MCWFTTITIILFSILNFQAIREKGFFLQERNSLQSYSASK